MSKKSSSKSNTTTTTTNKITTTTTNNNTAGSSSSGMIILRVRTQIGTWRVNDVSTTDTFKHIRSKLEDENKIKLTNISFTMDPNGKQIYHDDMTIQQAKLINGTMIYMHLDESNGSSLVVHKASTGLKRIEKDGSIVRQDTSSIFQSNGFRPGMNDTLSSMSISSLYVIIAINIIIICNHHNCQRHTSSYFIITITYIYHHNHTLGMLPLRSMKMQWTLNEFVSLDEQFQYKIKAPEKGICKLASIDSTAIEEFQNYMRNFDFRIMR